MSTGLQLLQDIEVEMVKLAHAYEVVAGELTKRANEEIEEQVSASPYRYGQYAGAVGAGAGAGMLAGGADAYLAARAQHALAKAPNGGLSAFNTAYRNDALKSLGKKVAIGTGVGALGAAGLAAYHSGYPQVGAGYVGEKAQAAYGAAKDHAMGLYSRFRGGNEPVMVDEGQTKAASLKALLSYVR